VIPHHTFTAPLLWAVMKLLAQTECLSIKAAWQTLRSPLSLDGLYHFLQRWRRRMSVFRSALCQIVVPPAGRHTAFLKQTIDHFQAAFSSNHNALSAFQMRFQASVAG